MRLDMPDSAAMVSSLVSEKPHAENWEMAISTTASVLMESAA
jgi:hypothetical protein